VLIIWALSSIVLFKYMKLCGFQIWDRRHNLRSTIYYSYHFEAFDVVKYSVCVTVICNTGNRKLWFPRCQRKERFLTTLFSLLPDTSLMPFHQRNCFSAEGSQGFPSKTIMKICNESAVYYALNPP